MESYNFVLDNLKITNTRASHLDTDYANWGVAVNDVMVPGSPQTKSISDQRHSYICRVRHRSSGPRMSAIVMQEICSDLRNISS